MYLYNCDRPTLCKESQQKKIQSKNMTRNCTKKNTYKKKTPLIFKPNSVIQELGKHATIGSRKRH